MIYLNDRKIFHLLVPPSNARIQGWVRSKPGAWNSTQASLTGGRGAGTPSGHLPLLSQAGEHQPWSSRARRGQGSSLSVSAARLGGRPGPDPAGLSVLEMNQCLGSSPCLSLCLYLSESNQ